MVNQELEYKEGIKKCRIPQWMSLGGYLFFKSKYLYQAKDPREQYERIARTLAKHVERKLPDAYDEFMKILWNGWLSPSTPILSNCGTTRGLTVSCQGGDIEDSVNGFYESLLESAVLTKQGFGISYNFANIRPRGSLISNGGKASGSMPVVEEFISTQQNIKQGERRGTMGFNYDIEGDDFNEWINRLKNNHDSFNVGWLIKDSFILLN